MTVSVLAKEVSLDFGGIKALDAVTFAANEGEITGLIGPNGAGKTSLFNVLSGIYTPNSGQIKFQAQDVTAHGSRAMAQLGLARTFQHVGLFPSVTVAQNIQLGALLNVRVKGLRGRARRAELAEIVDGSIADFGLGGVRDRSPGELPFGTAKTAELARAIASGPRVLLLDEPAGGLTPSELEAFSGRIRTIHDQFKLTTVLVEHHMGLVGRLCDRLIVLDHGKVITEGETAEVLKSSQVQAIYFGRKQ